MSPSSSTSSRRTSASVDSNTSSTALPSEVLAQIIAFIPRSESSTLHALLLASRALYHATVPHLYASIRLSSYDHRSPLLDAAPAGLTAPAPAARGPLSKRRGLVGKAKPTAGSAGQGMKTRKRCALEYVRTLEVDARLGGAFGIKAPLDLPGVRALMVDMRLLESMSKWPQRIEATASGGWGTVRPEDLFVSDEFTYLSPLRPSTLILKSIRAHDESIFLRHIPTAVRDSIRHVIFILADEVFPPTGCGDHASILPIYMNFLSRDHPLDIDIVLWTPSPGVLFRPLAATHRPRCLDLFAHCLGLTIAGPGKRTVRLVNTESMELPLAFDIAPGQKRSTEAGEKLVQMVRETFVQQNGTDEENDGVAEDTIDDAPPKVKSAEQVKKDRQAAEERITLATMEEFMLSLGDVSLGDVFTNEEMGPWLSFFAKDAFVVRRDEGTKEDDAEIKT